MEKLNIGANSFLQSVEGCSNMELEKVAEYLIKHEKIGEKDFAALMEGKLEVNEISAEEVESVEIVDVSEAEKESEE